MRQDWQKSLSFLITVGLALSLLFFGISCQKYVKGAYSRYYQLEEAKKLRRNILRHFDEISSLAKQAKKKADKIEKLQLFSSTDYLTAADYVEEALKPLKAAEKEAVKISEAVIELKRLRLPKEWKEHLRLLDKYHRSEEESLSALVQLYEGYREQYNLRYLIANITEVSNNAVKVFEEQRYAEAKDLFTQNEDIISQTKDTLKRMRNVEKLALLASYLDKDEELNRVSLERSKALLAKNSAADKLLYEKYKKLWQERESIQWKDEWKKYIASHEDEFYSTYFRESDVAANYWEKAENYYREHLKKWE